MTYGTKESCMVLRAGLEGLGAGWEGRIASYEGLQGSWVGLRAVKAPEPTDRALY